MADLDATVSVGGDPAAGGGSLPVDNRGETFHALSPTLSVGGGFVAIPHDNRRESVVAAGSAAPDTTPPTIDNFDPPVGTQLGTKQAVSFDLKDNQGLKRGAVFVVQSEGNLVIHDGDSALAPFMVTRTPIANGFRYTVRRGGSGWTAAPVFRYLVTDVSGNEAV